MPAAPNDFTIDLDVPRSALAVGAHPDDIEFGAGATLARWADAGCEITLLVCTDGSKGTWDPQADLAALVALRKVEAQAAAEVLGATTKVRFMDRVDAELENDRETRSELARHIREVRPEVLLGHDPWQRYRLHPDHRAAGFLLTDALVAARDPHFFPEHGIEHHRPDALLLFEADEPNHVETADMVHVERKIAALEAHRSQYESTMFISGDAEASSTARAEFRRTITDRAKAAGDSAGIPTAESFRLMPTDR